MRQRQTERDRDRERQRQRAREGGEVDGRRGVEREPSLWISPFQVIVVVE